MLRRDLLVIRTLAAVYMDDDFVIGDVEESQLSNQPKRKSPFIEQPADDSLDSETTSESGKMANKAQRKYFYDVGLPDLLPRECELRLDIDELVDEVDQLGPDDQLEFTRIEKRSGVAVSGRLTHQLVVFLRKGSDRTGERVYDLGCYIRASPPQSVADKEDASWSYPRVSILVMLINSVDPFSSESRVNKDCCTLSSTDPCRGWMVMASFKSVEDLRDQGFVFGSSTIVARGQASFDGCELVDDPDSPVPYAGLENQGATCYLNGLLQSLYHLGKFREIVYKGHDDTQESILTALQTVFFDLETEKDHPVSSEPLTRAFGWDYMDVGVQHDAQELNRILIDRIENRLKSNDGNEVKDLFCGKIENFIECLDVDFQSRREEDFYDIQLNVVRGYGPDQTVIESLSEALEEYLSVEVLEGPNAYDAGENRGKQRARKGVRFTKLPPVLTFQLMRFQFDLETGDMKKIYSKFAFDPTIDMSKYCPDSGQYVLYSVLVHSGGVDSGHYYSYARCSGGTWHKFDDTLVTRVSEFCAIENNFGGKYLQSCVDYLSSSGRTSSDGSTEGDEKVYSAYMLMYVRADLADSLLEAHRLAEVNPELASQLREPEEHPSGRRSSRRLNIRRTKSLDESLCTIRFLDGRLGEVFSNTVTKYTDLKGDWFARLRGYPENSRVSVDESATVATVADTDETSLNDVLSAVIPDRVNERLMLLLVPEERGKVGFFELTSSDRSEAISGLLAHSRLSRDRPLVLILAGEEKPISEINEICVGILNFDGESKKLNFEGFHNFSKKYALSDISRFGSVHVPARDGTLEPLTKDNLHDGTFVVTQRLVDRQESAQVYFDRLANTVSLDLIIYDPIDIKWSLNQMEAVEGCFVGKHSNSESQKRIHIPAVDMREPIDRIAKFIPEFDPRIHELLAYREDPFGPEARAGDNMVQPEYSMGNTVNRASFTYHCVIVPKRPTIDPGRRETVCEHVCVRFFDSRVHEVASTILVCQPSISLTELMRLSKQTFKISSETQVRLLDIDPHDCEIVSVFREVSSDHISVSTLLSWRSRNIFQNSIRIEVDDCHETELKCFHFDRSTRSPFGHPFLLHVPTASDAESARDRDLRALIAEKLDSPQNLARSWRITEESGKVMIAHQQHPITGNGTQRDRPLTIKQ